MNQPVDRPNTVLMVTAGMFVGLIVIVFARLAYGMILPPMRAGLDLSYQQAGVLGTVTALGYVSFVLIGGLAASRWGASRAIAFGIAIVTAGFTGLAFAQSYPAAVLLMTLLGIGTAFSFAPMVSLLATWYPERRGFVIGCMSAGIGAGLLLVGVLLPWLYAQFGDIGWRVTWGVFAASSAAVGIAALAILKDPPTDADGTQTPPPSADKWLVYRNPRVITVSMVYGIIGLTYMVQTIFMISYVVESGFSEAVAGSLLAMAGLLSVASGPVWGNISDRVGRGNALTAATGIVMLAMLLVLFDQSGASFFLHFF
ncbi:hypothetical protein CAI21_18435 [Alkalilimnicola ehrlichii]|uniref:Major facilitator superfamily (MFS) profile domain-containing protein n=1 Tax=Alkalilimnicola ehrlichii TaxID=351052 RepID=A0A3E0WK25_9GAMM|nr:MFS transporter [Alkalilimnicola ehrlichii]RFA25747.1 hypothetical protein CAI21_18435 [Alkalilimnicola ehrlichii]RFA32829.1 hypothetical protein CAL65_18685 [Alkalilimnicola ehrlichii]